ncbi:MAG: hypothetical protein P8Y81_09245, partial [Ignavibacteriaceae bacterium]
MYPGRMMDGDIPSKNKRPGWISRAISDFMFQLSEEEFKILKSQNVISSWGVTLLNAASGA